MKRPGPAVLVITVAALSAPGCSTDAGAPGPALSLPELPSLAALVPIETPLVGTPTELYTRIARGAVTCWFGPNGPLKGSYIYHAEAEPPSKGGRARIVLHEKDWKADDPRSLRVFRVEIGSTEGKPTLEVENVKVPEPMGSRLTGDVRRWAADEAGCGEGPVTAGWSAEAAVPGKLEKAKTSGKAKK